MIYELGTPRALDSLMQDGMLWPITYRAGQVGYIKDNYHFVPLDKTKLVQVKEDKAGSKTWKVVETPPQKLAPALLKKFSVDVSWYGAPTITLSVDAKDSNEARNKGIKKFAASHKIEFPKAFNFFKTHPLAITVKEL